MSAHDIHALLAIRRSPRAFDEARAVPRFEIERLLEAARWAPSCFNEQPWRYLVCERNVDEAAWSDLLACLVEGNRKWAQRAPVLIAALARAPDNPEAARVAAYDVGAASLNLCLEASALGLASHQMAGFDIEGLRATFALDARLTPLTVIAVGYPGDLQKLDERTRAKELAPRVRRAVTDFVVYGRGRFPA